MSNDEQARTDALDAANRERARRASLAVRLAIDELVKENRAVNPHAVANRAGVARSYIYSKPALLSAIRSAAGSKSGLKAAATRERATEESLRARLALALDTVQELKDEITALKSQQALLLGELREARRSNER